jgi:glycosyltransferase involved in cell wall biosynthesis
MRYLAEGLVTYTTTQAHELQARHRNKEIVAAPNALYHESEFAFDDRSIRDSILYVGRLRKDKKPDLLVRAFISLQAEYPELRLVIVGDGDSSDEVKSPVSRSPTNDAIEVIGFVADYQRLRALYGRAIASVSPGYVGLSLIQSLSFGVPMVISRNEPHSPELEAAVEGVNCVYFETDSVADLTAKILDIAANRDLWRERGFSIASTCAQTYSVEKMASGLIAALEGAVQ